MGSAASRGLPSCCPSTATISLETSIHCMLPFHSSLGVTATKTFEKKMTPTRVAGNSEGWAEVSMR